MNKNDEKLLTHFENIESNKNLSESIIKIQNNINIYGDSHVIVITAPKDDLALALSSYALSKIYASKNAHTLLVDCNMYNPMLRDVINSSNNKQCLNNILDKDINFNDVITHISDNLDVVFCDKKDYPTEIFKSEEYLNFIESVKEIYEHVVLIMPTVIEHQDMLLIKTIIGSSLLVVRRNRVSKKMMFGAVQFLTTNDMAYVGTIYLK